MTYIECLIGIESFQYQLFKYSFNIKSENNIYNRIICKNKKKNYIFSFKLIFNNSNIDQKYLCLKILINKSVFTLFEHDILLKYKCIYVDNISLGDCLRVNDCIDKKKNNKNLNSTKNNDFKKMSQINEIYKYFPDCLGNNIRLYLIFLLFDVNDPFISELVLKNQLIYNSNEIIFKVNKEELLSQITYEYDRSQLSVSYDLLKEIGTQIIKSIIELSPNITIIFGSNIDIVMKPDGNYGVDIIIVEQLYNFYNQINQFNLNNNRGSNGHIMYIPTTNFLTVCRYPFIMPIDHNYFIYKLFQQLSNINIINVIPAGSPISWPNGFFSFNFDASCQKILMYYDYNTYNIETQFISYSKNSDYYKERTCLLIGEAEDSIRNISNDDNYIETYDDDSILPTGEYRFMTVSNFGEVVDCFTPNKNINNNYDLIVSGYLASCNNIVIILSIINSNLRRRNIEINLETIRHILKYNCNIRNEIRINSDFNFPIFRHIGLAPKLLDIFIKNGNIIIEYSIIKQILYILYRIIYIINDQVYNNNNHMNNKIYFNK